LRHFATIYASWAASQAFYRGDGHLQAGCESVEDSTRSVSGCCSIAATLPAT